MAMFYNTVIAWSVYYLFLSFRSVVPWKGCDNDWNTYCCFPINDLNKIPIVKTHSLDTDKYQKIFGNGLIYRSMSQSTNIKRITLFDTRSQNEKNDSNSASLLFDGISRIFNLSDIQPPDSSLIYQNTTGLDEKIMRILRSFFLLHENQLKEPVDDSFLRDIPRNYIRRFHHDPSLFIKRIEEHINMTYQNSSVSIILNCAELMNNPTQEFYNRHLTEMNRSVGFEDFGGLKWELIVCLIVVFITVYFALWKGIKSAGKVNINRKLNDFKKKNFFSYLRLFGLQLLLHTLYFLF